LGNGLGVAVLNHRVAAGDATPIHNHRYTDSDGEHVTVALETTMHDGVEEEYFVRTSQRTEGNDRIVTLQSKGKRTINKGKLEKVITADTQWHQVSNTTDQNITLFEVYFGMLGKIEMPVPIKGTRNEYVVTTRSINELVSGNLRSISRKQGWQRFDGLAGKSVLEIRRDSADLRLVYGIDDNSEDQMIRINDSIESMTDDSILLHDFLNRRYLLLPNGEPPARRKDAAMMMREKRHGGINLDPRLLDMQIKRDGNGIPLPVNQQPIYDLKIDGFLPVIINITPVINLPLLLGLTDEGEDEPFAEGPDRALDSVRNEYFEELVGTSG